MNSEGPHIDRKVIYEGTLIGVLWRLFVSIAIKHMGGLVVFIVFLLLAGHPWMLGLIAFVFFVLFAWVTELVFHSHSS